VITSRAGYQVDRKTWRWCPISNPFFIDYVKERLQGNINDSVVLVVRTDQLL